MPNFQPKSEPRQTGSKYESSGVDVNYQAFLEHIQQILSKNGYPDKRVSLPLERMYAVAHEKQLNFNKVLVMLQERGIDHEKTTEKIIFFPRPNPAFTESSDGTAEHPQTPDLARMMAEAQAMLQNMSPQQISELQNMFANMSPKEKEELMRKARDLGLG